jgi:hypothetical protein
MTDDQNDSKNLRWWFWLLLFTPAIVCAAGTTIISSQAVGRFTMEPLFLVGLVGGGLLNLICSSFAAARFVAARSVDPYEQSGRLSWCFLFFVTNLLLCFGGCALGGKIGGAFFG